MKYAIASGAVFLAFQVHAGECLALDYQEMKEMSVEATTKEYCKAQSTGVDGLIRGIRADTDGLKVRSRTMGDQAEKCLLHARRIERILVDKGVKKESLEATCKALPTSD